RPVESAVQDAAVLRLERDELGRAQGQPPRLGIGVAVQDTHLTPGGVPEDGPGRSGGALVDVDEEAAVPRAGRSVPARLARDPDHGTAVESDPVEMSFRDPVLRRTEKHEPPDLVHSLE